MTYWIPSLRTTLAALPAAMTQTWARNSLVSQFSPPGLPELTVLDADVNNIFVKGPRNGSGSNSEESAEEFEEIEDRLAVESEEESAGDSEGGSRSQESEEEFGSGISNSDSDSDGLEDTDSEGDRVTTEPVSSSTIP